MPSPYSLLIANGQTVSSAFYVDRADRGLAIYVASHAAIGIRIEFAVTSASLVFGPVCVEDTGIIQVFSNGAADVWGVIKQVPSPWARIKVSSGLTTTTSFLVLAR